MSGDQHVASKVAVKPELEAPPQSSVLQLPTGDHEDVVKSSITAHVPGTTPKELDDIKDSVSLVWPIMAQSDDRNSATDYADDVSASAQKDNIATNNMGAGTQSPLDMVTWNEYAKWRNAFLDRERFLGVNKKMFDRYAGDDGMSPNEMTKMLAEKEKPLQLTLEAAIDAAKWRTDMVEKPATYYDDKYHAYKHLHDTATSKISNIIISNESNTPGMNLDTFMTKVWKEGENNDKFGVIGDNVKLKSYDGQTYNVIPDAHHHEREAVFLRDQHDPPGTHYLGTNMQMYDVVGEKKNNPTTS